MQISETRRAERRGAARLRHGRRLLRRRRGHGHRGGRRRHRRPRRQRPRRGQRRPRLRAGSSPPTTPAGGTTGGLAGENLGAHQPDLRHRRRQRGEQRPPRSAACRGPRRRRARLPVANSFWDSDHHPAKPPAPAAARRLRPQRSRTPSPSWPRPRTPAGPSPTTWAPPDPGHYPELYSVSPVIWVRHRRRQRRLQASPASFRPPVTQSGGPGESSPSDKPTTVPPLVPLVSPGLPLRRRRPPTPSPEPPPSPAPAGSPTA